MDGKTVETLYEEFTEMMKMADLEHTMTKNLFFEKLLDDPETAARFVLWSIDAFDRLSKRGRSHVGARYAQMIMEKIGDKEVFFKPKHFRPGVSFEKMNDEIQHLNREYVGLRKVLIKLLNHYGDLTLSREELAGIDGYDLVSRYNAALDVMQFGTQVQAQKWKTEAQIAAEIEAQREAEREKLIEEQGKEAVEESERRIAEYKEGCYALTRKYFPGKTDDEVHAILWSMTGFSYQSITAYPLGKIEEQLRAAQAKEAMFAKKDAGGTRGGASEDHSGSTDGTGEVISTETESCPTTDGINE